MNIILQNVVMVSQKTTVSGNDIKNTKQTSRFRLHMNSIQHKRYNLETSPSNLNYKRPLKARLSKTPFPNVTRLKGFLIYLISHKSKQLIKIILTKHQISSDIHDFSIQKPPMDQKAHHLKSTKAPYLEFATVPLAEVLKKQSKSVLNNIYTYILAINSQSQKKKKRNLTYSHHQLQSGQFPKIP